jgi:hypothetical protein
MAVILCLVAVVPIAQPAFAKPAVNVISMKNLTELKDVWQDAADKAAGEPEAGILVSGLLGTDKGRQDSQISAVDLARVYNILLDPRATATDSEQATRVFVELERSDIMRECILHRISDIVIMAARYAEETQDMSAIPYLHHVLKANNYRKDVGKEAAVHELLKRELFSSLVKLADMTKIAQNLEPSRPMQVSHLLGFIENWAAENNIRLFEDSDELVGSEE